MIVVYQSTVQKRGKPEPAFVLELLTVQKHSQMHTHVLKLNCAVKHLYLLNGTKMIIGLAKLHPKSCTHPESTAFDTDFSPDLMIRQNGMHA